MQAVVPRSDVCGVGCSPAGEAPLGETSTDPKQWRSLEDTVLEKKKKKRINTLQKNLSF